MNQEHTINLFQDNSMEIC